MSSIDLGWWGWDDLRLVNFFILFVCFVILVYRGVFKLVVDKKVFYWDRLMNLLWCFGICAGLAETLYKDVQGGFRVLLIFLISLVQLYVVLFKSPYDRDIPDVDLRS